MARFSIEYNNTRKDLLLCVAGRGETMVSNGPGRPKSRRPTSQIATSLAAIDCYAEECQEEPWFVVDKLADPIERDVSAHATFEAAEQALKAIREKHGVH